MPPGDPPASANNGAPQAPNSDSNGATESNVLVEENRKCLALRLLALKVLAYLNWDLTYLETKLPLCMVNLLLTEFLRMTAVPDAQVGVVARRILVIIGAAVSLLGRIGFLSWLSLPVFLGSSVGV